VKDLHEAMRGILL